MKTKVEQNRDEAAPATRSFVIETDEDCQVAQDKLDTLTAAERDENERDALRTAIAAWHARKKC